MAIDSKFTEEEIKAISIANNDQIDLKNFPWINTLKSTNNYDDVMNILETRMAEIRELYETANQDEQSEMEQEWVALVIQKDRHLRLKIQEENEVIKNQYMVQLYNTLKVLGTFSFPNQRDIILTRNMDKMLHQVEKYCTRNNIEKTNKEQNHPANHQPVNIPMPPPIPPPPPPPPPPPQQLFCKPKLQPQPRTPQIQRKPKLNDSKPLEEQKTPLDSLNNELLKSIKRGRALELKRTPCKRSPGGTPMKRPRRLSESDTSDLITLALKRKFKNVNSMMSPKENYSPNINSPLSPSMEYP